MSGAPYDRLPKETSTSFEAFVVYRDMGVERSLQKVAQRLGKSKALMDRWSSRHRWVKRSSAWDAHVDLRTRNAELKALEDMRQRHTKASLGLQTVAISELMKLQGQSKTRKGSVIKPRDLIRMLKEGALLERLTRGEPGEITQHGIGEIDLSEFSPAELKLLAKIQTKLGTG